MLQIRQEVDKAGAATMDNFVNFQHTGGHVPDFHGKFQIKRILKHIFRKQG